MTKVRFWVRKLSKWGKKERQKNESEEEIERRRIDKYSFIWGDRDADNVEKKQRQSEFAAFLLIHVVWWFIFDTVEGFYYR